MIIFGNQSAASVASEAIAKGVSEADVQSFLMFAATFFCNMGNYKSFGDTKFIPGIPMDTFHTIVKTTKAYGSNTAHVEKLFNHCKDKLYSLDARERQLGLGAENGVSAYFDSKMNSDDAGR
jgi:dipeptidyl-peptidase-3